MNIKFGLIRIFQILSKNCYSPNAVLIADNSELNQAISDLTKSIQFKIFDQWQGVPIINSTYTFESNNTLENVFMPQSNGYLKINTSNIKQVGKYSLNYNNLINLPDPKKPQLFTNYKLAGKLISYM